MDIIPPIVRARAFFQQAMEIGRELPQEEKENLFQRVRQELLQQINTNEPATAPRTRGTRTRLREAPIQPPNNALIRHRIGERDEWFCRYDATEGEMVLEGENMTERYEYPSTFARNHYTRTRPDRTSNANGWTECEIRINGNWVSIGTYCGIHN